MTSPYVELEVITDYLVGADAERLSRSVVRLPRRPLTLNELLRLKLSQDVHAFNERRTDCYGAEYLAEDELTAVRTEGRQMAGNAVKKGKANPDVEYKLMLRAFAEHRFKVLVDGTELASPTDRVTPTDETRIRFVRLTPYK